MKFDIQFFGIFNAIDMNHLGSARAAAKEITMLSRIEGMMTSKSSLNLGNDQSAPNLA
jgi:hypothetical protein